MTWIDGLLIVIVALSTILGVVRGFFREVASFVIWVIAFFAAYFFSDSFTFLAYITSSQAAQMLIAFIVVLLIVLIIGFFIIRIISKMITQSGLSPLNRVLGAVFGLLRGFVLVLAIIYIIDLTSVASHPLWQGSVTVQAGQMAIGQMQQHFFG